MAMQQDDVARARSVKLKRFAMVNPMIGEIAGSLLDLGGAAHRDVVIDLVARRRGGFAASEGLRRELIEAFDLYCEFAGVGRKRPLLHLPFGKGSYRWGLTPQAHDMLMSAAPSRAG
jgi:hypothetical protein